MLVLKILGIVLLLVSIVVVLNLFNKHCEAKFSYSFFNMPSFWATAIALAFLLSGNEWRESALESHGDVLNGIVLMCLGGLVVLGIVYSNFAKTNFLYGLGGSALQLSTFGVLAYLGFFVLIIGVILSFVVNLGAQDVRVINR